MNEMLVNSIINVNMSECQIIVFLAPQILSRCKSSTLVHNNMFIKKTVFLYRQHAIRKCLSKY